MGGASVQTVQVLFDDSDLEVKQSKWKQIFQGIKSEMESLDEKWALYFHTASTITSQILNKMQQTTGVMMAESALSMTLTGISIARIEMSVVEAVLKQQYVKAAMLQSLAFSMGFQLVQGQIAKQRAFQLKQYTEGIRAFEQQYRTS